VYNNEEFIMPTTKRILLVDDDATLRATLRTCLEAVGYQCKEAKDGSDARDWLKEGHSVDLIVTDYQMPKVNGLELIKGLKRQVNTASIPIIFYSGQLSHELKLQANQAGSHAVIEKPFPLQEFLDLVAQVCKETM
jgi:two-component system chemotaxis response regulator CheY